MRQLALVLLVLLTLVSRPTHGQTPPHTLAAVLALAANFGYASIHSGYASPQEPIPQARFDQLIKDVEAAQLWAGTASACISSDPRQFQATINQLRSERPLSGRAWQIVDALSRTIFAAVQRPGCPYGLGSPALSAFYVSGMHLGIAIARTDYYGSAQGFPAVAVEQLRGDLEGVKSNLRGAGAAFEPLAQYIGTLQGFIATSQPSALFSRLTAIYQSLETSGNSVAPNVPAGAIAATSQPGQNLPPVLSDRDAAGKPKPTSPGCRNQCYNEGGTCYDVCKEAMVLMCVVAGDTSNRTNNVCAACIKTHCVGDPR